MFVVATRGRAVILHPGHAAYLEDRGALALRRNRMHVTEGQNNLGGQRK
jgi:hypothetical protein